MSSDSRALKIAISSHSGCGNTTATNNVGATLELDVVNYTFRDLATDLDLPFETIQQKASRSPIYDFLTDLNLMRASLRSCVVVGSRLAGWLVDADLRVWLHAPLEARAKRIFQREPDKHAGYESVLYRTLQRDEQNRKRYLEIYGIDINDRSDFDITINTEKLTAEQVSSLIVAAARWASQNELDRGNPHLLRIRKIISDNLGIDPRVLVDGSLSINTLEIYQRLQGDAALATR
ncbi:MAG TPA: cytidylate kinase family protein [Chthoniobacterales bacterium]|nr:cytidylate kinase family protein [Chthoniobacterales bacterium]